MRRGVVAGVVVATAGAVTVAGTMMAYANWSVPGRPAVLAAATARMPAGVVPGVSRSGGTAVVTWRSQQIGPRTPMQRYIVTAHSVFPGRPAVVRVVPGTAARNHSVVFTVAEVAGGRWYWTVRPVFASWQGADGGRSPVVGFPAPTNPPPPTFPSAPSPTPASSPAQPPHPPADPSPPPIPHPGGEPGGPPSPLPPQPGGEPQPGDDTGPGSDPVPPPPAPVPSESGDPGPPPPIAHPPVGSHGP